MAEAHSLDDLSRQAFLLTKVYVQRDYSEGTSCRFQIKFLPELEPRIEKNLFEDTVRTFNKLYTEAEKIGAHSYVESCLGCLTGYTLFMCMETRYEKEDLQVRARAEREDLRATRPAHH
ncbi:golgin subfamily A member 7 isoform X2 [Lampetra fluviatilis]